MKYPFDNSGVAQVQFTVLSLSREERRPVIEKIRHNFNGFMLEWFDLAPHQVDQLYEMPEDLRYEISTDLADSWEEGAEVNFYKEEKDDEDEGAKEIINSRRVAADKTTPPEAAPHNTIAQMSITIRYR